MSLPLGGAWPPPPHEVALAQQAVWSAWLVGDPEQLSSVYGGTSNATARDFFSREGGVLPAVARFFWGRPSATGNRKARLHVPIAADIATVSADLLFSESPQFVVEAGNEAAQKRVDLLNQGTFHAQLLEAAELTSALGGGWLRLVWDKERADHVMVDTVSADNGIGEWWMGRLQAVTFFTEFTDADKSTVLRHLERHEPGAIFHGLYRGTRDTLGTPVPLADHPSTAPLAELVDEEGAIPTGVTTLTAAYVANMRPQRRWRRIEPLAEVGRSDYDGAEPMMDALDECYTSWMRDLRLAKARLIVPEYMLTNLGKGQGMAWDEDREIFTQLNMAPADERADQITPQQFAIRVEEHQRTASQLVGDILRAAGYSRGSLGDATEAGAQMTATEVVARERESARTRDKKTRYWSQALDSLLTTWLALDATIYNTGASGQVATVWPDASQPDAESLARTVEIISRAEAASTEVKVRMLHPDWDDAQIMAEVTAIKAEGGMNVPDLGPLP